MSTTQAGARGGTADPAPMAKTLRGLDALNFFLADVRDGLGPYLAIYLIAVRGPDQGWNEATTGLIMTIAGVAGLIAQTPAGVLIDGYAYGSLSMACYTLGADCPDGDSDDPAAAIPGPEDVPLDQSNL